MLIVLHLEILAHLSIILVDGITQQETLEMHVPAKLNVELMKKDIEYIKKDIAEIKTLLKKSRKQ